MPDPVPPVPPGAPAPPGSLQFFDGFYPSLPAGDYTLTVDHTLPDHTSPDRGGVPVYSVVQDVRVRAPQFAIDPAVVEMVYPADGARGVYASQLPFAVLADPALPWERSLVPGRADNPTQACPWLALAIFAPGEIRTQQATSPLLTAAVADLKETADVFRPTLLAAATPGQAAVSPSPAGPADGPAQCQTIVVTGAAFKAVLPSTADLAHLAHCRRVNTAHEGDVLRSVLLGNRMPPTGGSAVRYSAHIVSLEGFADYLPSSPGRPLPTKPDGSPKDVQLVSLYSWTFTAEAAANQSFGGLVQGLIHSRRPDDLHPHTPALTLRLPVPRLSTPRPRVPADGPVPDAVRQRLGDGYVPLRFVAGSGEDTLAWYRGPLTAAVPQPLPAVGGGDQPRPVAQATAAEPLMIYSRSESLFDLSYAAAWNLGRALALADAGFSRAVHGLRRSAIRTAADVAQRRARPYLASLATEQLTTRDASRRQFSTLMAGGLGQKWTTALAAVHAGQPSTTAGYRPPRRFARPSAATHPTASGTPTTAATAAAAPTAAASHSRDQTLSEVARWLAGLAHLAAVPFSYLVPSPAMLPVESIRFFYVDPNWTDALQAGALSLALHGGADVHVGAALLPHIDRERLGHQAARRARVYRHAAVVPSVTARGVTASGVLLRSQLVSGWPRMAVTASRGGAPLNVLRDEVLASNVRLVIFDGIPDAVTLAEPYAGLRFGFEDWHVKPRHVTVPAYAGWPIDNAGTVQADLRPPAPGAVGGVVKVSELADALGRSAGVVPFTPAAVVMADGRQLDTRFVDGSHLQVTLPAERLGAPGVIRITVGDGGRTTESQPFLVMPSGAAPASDTAADASVPAADGPAITSLSPPLVAAGDGEFNLVVTGSGFAPTATVQWNGVAVDTVFKNDAELQATVPADRRAAEGVARLAVVDDGGAMSPAVDFAVVGAGPAVGALTPPLALAGAGDLRLTVIGVNLGDRPTVYFDDMALAPAEGDGDPDRVTVTVPVGRLRPGTAQVSVSDGTARSAGLPFLVAGPVPSIRLLRPARATACAGGDLTVDVFGGFGAGNFAMQMVAAPASQRFAGTQEAAEEPAR